MLLFVTGTLLILAFLVYATYKSGRLIQNMPVRENLLLAPVENMFKGLLVVVCAALALFSGLPLQRFGLLISAPLSDLAAGIVAGLATYYLIGLLTPWALARFGKQSYSIAVIKNIFPRNRREWLLTPLAMVLAVLLEELLFRGLALGGLGTLVPPVVLVVVLGVIFGMMHSAQGPLGMAVATIIGVEFSMLFLWSGSLLIPFVAHYIINMLQLLRAQEEWQWIQEY